MTEQQEKIDIAALEQAAFDRGRTEWISAENKRISDIEKLALSGHEDLVAAAKTDPAMTAEKLAVQIIAAEKEKGGRYLASMQTNEAELPKVSAVSDAPSPDDAPPEERAKAEWNKSEKLRKEFGTFDAYKAFRDAEAAGQVKILKGN